MFGIRLAAGAVLVSAALLAGCSAATPKGGIPPVAGNYRGSMSISAPDLFVSLDAPMRMFVEQSGARVTASGTVSIEGSESTFVWVGSIDETGLFSSDETEAPSALDTSLCGEVQVARARLTFTGRRAVLSSIVDTARCGPISYDATLTR